jgi:hypothetical protein
MYKNMTYQQAKRIRGQSLSSVIADQLILGGGYGSSIKRGIGIKTSARIASIKETFDPLNIAKFLTGGSRLGPAILGKMTGRSRKDIEYFTGQARKVGVRENKIGALPSQGSGNISGIESVLKDILSFLRNSHDKDMILREKENNLREGQQHADEKRHKDLLKALASAGGGSPTATQVTSNDGGGGFLGGIFDKVMAIIDEFKKAYEWVNNLKFLTGVSPWVRNMLLVDGAASFLSMLPVTAFLAPFMLAAEEKEKIRANPNAPEYKDNPYAMMLRKEAETEGQAAEINIRKTVKQIPRRQVQDFVDSALPDEDLKRELGNDRNSLKVWLKNNPQPSAMYQAPVAALAGSNNGAASASNVETKPVAPVEPAVVETTPVTPAPVTPAQPEPTTPSSAAVSVKTNENLKLGLQATVTPKTNTVTNNTHMNSTKADKRKIEMPSVRNTEETFKRLIYNSTRVV